MGNSTGWPIAELALVVVATLIYASLAVGIFSRGVHKADLAPSWARSHGILLSPATTPFARWYCQLTGVLRVTGAISGLVIGSVFDYAFGVDSSAGFGFWAWVISGWLLGAAWAERQLPRPGETGVASLTPRSTTDYIARGLAVAPLVATALTALVAAVAIIKPAPPSRAALRPPSTTLTFLIGTAVAIAICALVVVLRRAVLDRRQPLMEPELLAVDDAVRSSTIHHLSGAGTAAIVCVAGQLITLQIEAVPKLPFGLRGWLPLLPLVGALFAWRYWSFKPWRVSRSLRAVSPS
ncbi:MAG: hypothetical protein KDA95_02510 [Acidimicrobiales bacterium]|nr:hypothetical protein [Acidimicrobiales bacterium]